MRIFSNHFKGGGLRPPPSRPAAGGRSAAVLASAAGSQQRASVVVPWLSRTKLLPPTGGSSVADSRQGAPLRGSLALGPDGLTLTAAVRSARSQ